VGIELRVGDKPAGIVERGLEVNLHLSATGPLDPGAVPQIHCQIWLAYWASYFLWLVRGICG
jgi:hypothetical protein